MSEAQVPIASAVAVPEDPVPRSPPQGHAKRRQSSISETGSKRPRLSPERSTDGHDGAAQPLPAAERRADRRKSGQVEERKRGQRLFGALLGTLSQSSSSTAQKRRADIEKKQQAKLRLQAEEYDEKKKKDLDELIKLRRQEHKKYEEQSMHLRHSNLLAMAHFLQTKAEPKLYYKPWELLPGDEDRIKSQIAEAEATVDREVADFNERRRQEQPPNSEKTNGAATDDDGKPAETSETVGSGTNQAEESTLSDANATNDNTPLPTETLPTADPPHEAAKESGDDGGEVVLEAEEDTVIY
ncbi:MAG: hypothetical protein M1819_000855 [Sarea resinae]|nr:MAG: hypothetical protein M1819_000855 [Sarea resinae]